MGWDSQNGRLMRELLKEFNNYRQLISPLQESSTTIESQSQSWATIQVLTKTPHQDKWTTWFKQDTLVLPRYPRSPPAHDHFPIHPPTTRPKQRLPHSINPSPISSFILSLFSIVTRNSDVQQRKGESQKKWLGGGGGVFRFCFVLTWAELSWVLGLYEYYLPYLLYCTVWYDT